MDAKVTQLSPDQQMARTLFPKSIAVIGASTNPNKIGGRPIAYCKKYGFDGDIYPINPTSEVVQGLPAYGRLAHVDDTPDLAVIALPAREAVAAVADCAAKGVGTAVVMTSGFAEVGGFGAELQQEMMEIAHAVGMRIVGPNSQGIANFGMGVIASFATMFTSTVPQDGPVAIVSQSGAMSVIPYAILRERGIGVRYAHATGNEADLTIADFTRAAVADPDIKLVLLYFESINDAEGFEAAARIAADRGIPIVAVKAGRTAAGQTAATSHTGALAVPDRVINAFLESCRIWRAQDVRGLVNATELYLADRWPTKRNIAIIANSGASGVMAADLAEEEGLSVAPLTGELKERLNGVLPDFATAGNPIDLTAKLLTDNDLFGNTLATLAEDRVYDLVLATIPNAGDGYDIKGFAKSFAEFGKRTGAVVASVMPQTDARATFHAAGVPSYAYDTDAVAALAQIVGHRELMDRAAAPAADLIEVTLPDGTGPFLDEASSLDLLKDAGIRVPSYRLCRTVDEACAAYAEMGPDVVVKACSEQLPHKSEYGLVTLSIAGEEDLRSRFDWMKNTVIGLGVSFGGIIVAEKVQCLHELALGAQYDPQFGAMVLIGYGGKYIEAMKDYAMLRYPFGSAEVTCAVGRLVMAPVLAGVRGEPRVDLAALGDVAARLGSVVHGAGGHIRSIDLNPLMVGRDGTTFTAADALIEREAVPSRKGHVDGIVTPTDN